MKEAQIAKAALNQIDNKIKLRPVLLLKEMRPFDDWLVCGISTQLNLKVDDFDLLITDQDPDFKKTGLVKTSLIRLGYLAVIPERIIEGSIGSITPENYQYLISNLVQYLKS